MSDNLYFAICSYQNLMNAYKKARKKKTKKDYVLEFEKNLKENLLLLQTELLLHSYRPKPLKTFIIRDPKTRKISKSDFRDRIVHHALCNIIEPIFEKSFIYDSYANRTGKGVLKAIKRFEKFSRKVSRNNHHNAYVLKADIKKYFENVNHDILINILQKKISDKKVIFLIKTILSNYKISTVNFDRKNTGMPLGNLTSQFFANVYLNELDYFAKQKLSAKYYIRYVDDFVIFNNDCNILECNKTNISVFLNKNLKISLHPDKSRVINLIRGVEFLGMKIFPKHKILKRKNIRKFKRKLDLMTNLYSTKIISYDEIYDFVEGWTAYSKNADTYNLRTIIISECQKPPVNRPVA